MKKYLFLLLFSFFQIYTSSAQDRLAILCGKLITAADDRILENQVLLVEGERILAIGGSELLADGLEIIDLSDYTVLPGLIDAHTHPLIYGADYQVNHLRGSSAFNALRGLNTVQNWLKEGWTTIRIAGDADVHYAHLEIRDAINRGLFEGPRIVGAGHYLSITGGGGDINNLSPHQQVIPDGLIVNGVDEVRKAVREEFKNGSDWIKVLVTGAFMSSGDNPQNIHFSPEELRTLMEEANRRGKPVMAHAHSTEGINLAIKMGVRSIEHGTFLSDESIALFLEYGTYLIPTRYIGEYAMSFWEGDPAQAKGVELHKKYREQTNTMLRKAIQSGVKIGVGSDNVGFPPNFAANEFGELVKLGMTPIQAIQAGTRVNAALLEMESEIGTLEVGKYADLIATKINPLEDISALTDVQFVMKGGKVIRSTKD